MTIVIFEDTGKRSSVKDKVTLSCLVIILGSMDGPQFVSDLLRPLVWYLNVNKKGLEISYPICPLQKSLDRHQGFKSCS